MSERPERAPSNPSRRGILRGAAGAAGTVVAAAVAAPAASAATSYAVVPKLPGEISRVSNKTSPATGRKYESIDVSISGDRTRLYVPHSMPPNKTKSATMVWFYHSNGSTYDSLSGIFVDAALLAIDQGWICICPNYAGSKWTTSPATTAQKRATSYVTSLWTIGASFLRANSGGGALMSWSYGNKLVPNARGMYSASAVWDMEDIYDRDPVRVRPVYNFSKAACRATNPMRLPQSAWSKARIRVTCSKSDQIVPPSKHGTALYNKARPVAKEATIVYHPASGDLGHSVPASSAQDMVTVFARWLREGPA